MRFGIRAAAALIATVGTNSFASAFTTSTSRARSTTSHLTMSTLPSWSDLQTSSSSTPVGSALDNDVALRPTGRAAPFVQNKLRLFDSEDFSAEKPPKITLYRDHAGWCPYCRKCGVAAVSSSCHRLVLLEPSCASSDMQRTPISSIASSDMQRMSTSLISSCTYLTFARRLPHLIKFHRENHASDRREGHTHQH